MSMDEFISNCIKERDEIIKKYRNGILMWKQKDGSKINVKDMEVGHIKNCLINFNNLMINFTDTDGWIEAFEQELKKREPDKGFFAANRAIKYNEIKPIKFPWDK